MLGLGSQSWALGARATGVLFAVVSMGSTDHRFSLAEILAQSYSVQEGRGEAAQDLEQPDEELEKHFGAQV